MTGQRPEHAAAARRLGEALRTLQQSSGRTLRVLETQVRISDSSLSRYFSGKTVPSWPVVRDLCRSMGADPSEYRALWEAADRTSPTEPADTGTPSAAQPAALTWQSRLRERLSGRRALVTVGVAIGLVTGVLLTLLGIALVTYVLQLAPYFAGSSFRFLASGDVLVPGRGGRGDGAGRRG